MEMRFITENRKGNFTERIEVRITKEQKDQITKIVNKNQDKYYNISHYISAAIAEKLRSGK
jgi:Arc/MetJ-type ribon-helix-helix transcriptional regulator